MVFDCTVYSPIIPYFYEELFDLEPRLTVAFRKSKGYDSFRHEKSFIGVFFINGSDRESDRKTQRVDSKIN
jgi:hypothetical protein